ncbi:MAG: extracellular solute-binding protein [Clostridiales bacterium]|nr:extracellular solute-binding protein [Clostridiales bacterium]
MKRIITVFLALLLLFTSCQKDSKKTGGRSDWKPPETEPEEEWTGPTVTVAYADRLDEVHQSRLTKFEKDEGVKIIALDYSEYNTSFDPTAGRDKLALDMVTGTVKPDLVITPGVRETVAVTMREKKLYQDLTPFLDADDTVNRDTVFGAILELYTADDGALWGITEQFTVETIIGNDALLGKYAGQSGWTLDDFLDLAESLPEDIVLIPSLSQQIASEIIFGVYGFSAFLDRSAGTCSFDSPTFVRYLNFLRSLPATWDELRAQSPYDDLPSAEKYEYAYNNRLALANRTYINMGFLTSDISVFGTDAYTRIGYPDSAGYAFCPTTDWTYMIAAGAEKPDTAWKIIRAFFEPTRAADTGRVIWSGGLPVLKNLFDVAVQQTLDQTYFLYFSGGGGAVTKDPEHPFTEADLTAPGFVFDFTEEDAARFRALFDSRNVRRIADQIPSEVNAIVTEEISSFLAGHSTAETCAAAIQSRVTLWMAEHQ